MATPGANYINGRMLLELPGTRMGPDAAYKLSPGGWVVVLLWIKLGSQGTPYKQVENASVNTSTLQGYVVAWATLPPGEYWETYDVMADPDRDETGHRPTVLRKGSKLAGLQFGGAVSKHAEVVEVTGPYGDEGIGAIVRNALGDAITILVEWRQ